MGRLRYTASLVALITACSDSGSSGSDAHETTDTSAVTTACTPGTLTTTRGFVVSAVQMPTSPTDFAVDLDGDGQLDNHYGELVADLGGGSEAAANEAITAGSDILLIQHLSGDAAFTTDTCSLARAHAGLVTSSPDFSGSGTFAQDPATTSDAITGPIVAGVFDGVSEAPQGALIVQLPLVDGVVAVPLVDVHVRYTISDAGLASGSISGAIRVADIPAILVGTAAEITADIAKAPSSTTSQTQLSLFDGGGTAADGCGATCKNPDGSCAVAGDKRIDACELLSNGVIRSLFEPDVELFDADDDFAPTPRGTHADALSVGFGFTAVSATIQ